MSKRTNDNNNNDAKRARVEHESKNIKSATGAKSAAEAAVNLMDDDQMAEYPRPTGHCGECNSVIILHAGAKVRPYWAHKSLGSCSSKNMQNSMNRELAIVYLARFIAKHTLEIDTKCINCNAHSIHTITKRPSHTLETVGELYWDILTGQHEWDFGITFTAGSDIDRERAPFKWARFNASDVIDALWMKEDAYPDVVRLANQHQISRCGEGLCKLKLEDLGKRLGYLKEYTVYDCAARALLDEARTGAMTVVQLYNTDYKNKLEAGNDQYWDELLRRGRCLRCTVASNSIKHGHPFCYPCYSVVSGRSDNYKRFLQRAEPARVSQLYAAFDALMNTCEENVYASTCQVCKRDYRSRDLNVHMHKDPQLQAFMQAHRTYLGCGGIQTTVLWNGKWKSCCDVCLTKYCDEKKLE